MGVFGGGCYSADHIPHVAGAVGGWVGGAVPVDTPLAILVGSVSSLRRSLLPDGVPLENGVRGTGMRP